MLFRHILIALIVPLTWGFGFAFASSQLLDSPWTVLGQLLESRLLDSRWIVVGQLLDSCRTVVGQWLDSH